MNEDQIIDKWDQLIGSLKESWGDLTDQELEAVKGKKDQLIGLLEEKYGETKEAIEDHINQLLEKLS